MKATRVDSNAVIPARGSSGAAGFDLYATHDIVLEPGCRAVVKTGIILQISHGWYGRIAPRSGMAVNHGIDVLAGVIDSDFRGEVGVVLYNTSDRRYPIAAGYKIAQIIFERCWDGEIEEAGSIDDTDRGVRGFGSTGL